MLNNIESLNIIELLFSHLNEKIKLKSIKYNKNLQNLNNINLTNYKFISNGRYREYEIKCFEKEYDNYGYLSFEGEFFNGEKNGKGKEYYYGGELKFEGDYLNGKRNGKGKEYYDNGILLF